MPSSRRHVNTVVTATAIAVGVALAGCSSTASTAKTAAPHGQGANPVAWVGEYCSGLAEVVTAQAEAAKMPATPQGHKDGLIMVADAAQQAFTNVAHHLTQLGPPAITNGTRVQDTMVGFFTTAAATVGDRRARLTALDANDPNFAQKADQQLSGPDLSAATTQMQGLSNNHDLASAFNTAPQCQRLRDTAMHE